MERVPTQTTTKPEAVEAATELSSAEHVSMQSPIPEAPKEQVQQKIKIIKERLLSAGMMTIEPLEGDPFVLSREHVSTGRGVTTYMPDGTVVKTSIEEYRAQLARDIKAARYFNQKPQEQERPARKGLTGRVKSWLKFASSLWSKFWKF